MPNTPSDLIPAAWNIHALIDQAPIGIVRSTVDGNLLYVNAALAQLLEFNSPAAMLAENAILRYRHVADRAALIDQLRQTGSVQNQEVTLLTRTGAERIVLASLTRDGEIVSSMLVDITARKRAEADVQAQAARLEILAEASRAFAEAGTAYQAVLDQVAETIASGLNAECMIYLLSKDSAWLQLAAIYDLDPEKVVLSRKTVSGDPLRVDEPSFATRIFQTSQPIFIPVVDREQMHAASKPAYRSSLDLLGVHSIIGMPMRTQGRTIGVLVVFRHQTEQPPLNAHDLTLAQDLADRAAMAIQNMQLFGQLDAERALLARRVAERTADLSLANAELARAARLKDEFLASMSHELRTPLNSILGRSEALQEQIYGPVTPEQVKALQGVEESGRHLLSLINDILDLSKIEAGRLELESEPLELDLLCPLCLRMVAQVALMKRITLSSRYDSQVQTLRADERRLKQILVNLLSNAVKFTPEGGKVGLDLRGDPEEQTVTFTVWDTGIGIAAEDLPRLFQPFVQLDSSLSRQYVGSGLGLSLVARLAKAHGGSIRVESTRGEGSCFHVTLPWLPVAAPDRIAPEASELPTARPAIGQAMVVEDSPTASAQLARYLQELGAQVEVLPHGTGVLERAIALQPDVILLDILLPDDDGWNVLRQLKAEPRTQAIPVIIASVVDLPERARALGAAAALLKPIDRAMLEQALRRVLARQEDAFIQVVLVATPTTGRPKLLLAEDNEANIATLSDYLRAKGYDLIIARNGGEAIIRAQEERPDAILMDIQMPGVDGLEAIRRIRADVRLAQIPIIAVTALAMPGDRERCLEAGADDYLTKPVHLRKLVATIEALRGKRGEGTQPLSTAT